MKLKTAPTKGRWATIQRMVLEAAGMIRPSARMTVAEWAERKRYLNTPGAYVGPWKHDKTPYLIEMQEVLTSLEHTGCIICGPARSGKSDIFFNWLGYSIDCDPADMRVYLQTRFWAEDWSQGDLDKAFEAREPGQRVSVFKKHLLPGKHSSTLTRKRFISGMKLNLSWPAITEMSGKTVPRLWLNDYDHMEQDVSKMGAPFWLAKKRATTFKQFGMTVAESTPGFEVIDPNWIAKTLHQAPPVADGVLKLYNQGDRRRWYWKCPNHNCQESFEPSFSLLTWDDEAGTTAQIGLTVAMECPCCGHRITEADRDTIHAGYPRTCRWLKDGQTWDADGIVHGEGEKNEIASFWLKGPAAFAQNWASMVTEYLNAMRDYEDSGITSGLKTNFELSQGEPFVMPRDESSRLPEELKNRAEDWGGTASEPVVPEHVRFLMATVDVQARAFVVQVTGIGEGGDYSLVDMYKIRKSNRIDPNDKRREHALIDPGAYAEDWALLIPEVIEKTYPLADGSGRRMAIKIVGCDSGGREGVTANAYEFWRSLRDDELGRGHHNRFHLIKGEASRSAPRRRRGYPDANRKDRHSGARGDVPVEFYNSDMLKDQVYAMLGRVDKSGPAVRFPIWAPNWVYTQLTAETRVAGKGWTNASQRRNETWDLTYYAVGLGLHPSIRLEHIDWSKPDEVPGWARPWGENSLVIAPDDPNPILITQASVVDMAAIGAEMA